MEIFEYESYDDYLKYQKKWNELKFGKLVYVREETINYICDEKAFAGFILCHGTRDASEQKFFKRRFPGAEVVGSEIGPSALESPMTVEWDFNKQNDSWLNKFDIVYSNSFDHSITPLETLKVWKDQLNQNGMLFLEYAENRSNPSESDPLGATNTEVEKWINEAGMVVVKKLGRQHNIKHGGTVFCCKVK